MRLAAVACMLAAVAVAQRDPFAGVFQGDSVALELKGAGGKYSGTLTVQGQSFPATATASGTTATGAFTVDGRSYSFTFTAYGNGYKLASEGSEYLLTRRQESAAATASIVPAFAATPVGFAPASPPPTFPAPEGPPPPLAAAPTGRIAGGLAKAAAPSIVGNWRNATGYARFNPDGTGTIDGESGRYEIHGSQITLIGARGQLTLPFAIEGDRLTLTANG